MKDKGKDPVVEEDYQGSSKLPVRRTTPVGRGGGLVMNEAISVSSGGASGFMPIWDVSGGCSGGVDTVPTGSAGLFCSSLPAVYVVLPAKKVTVVLNLFMCFRRLPVTSC
jgi:hypothetical protein